MAERLSCFERERVHGVCPANSENEPQWVGNWRACHGGSVDSLGGNSIEYLAQHLEYNLEVVLEGSIGDHSNGGRVAGVGLDAGSGG